MSSKIHGVEAMVEMVYFSLSAQHESIQVLIPDVTSIRLDVPRSVRNFQLTKN